MSQNDFTSSQEFFGTLVGKLVDARQAAFPKLVRRILREIREGGSIAEEAAAQMLSRVLEAPRRRLRLAAAHLLLSIRRNVTASLLVVINQAKGKPLALPECVSVVASIARLRAWGFPADQLAEALVAVAVADFGGQRRAALQLLRQIGKSASGCVEHLFPLLFVESRAVRQEAAVVIGRIGDGERSVLTQLANRYADLEKIAGRQPAISRVYLIRAIGNLGIVSCQFLVREMNKTRHPGVLCETAGALSGLVAGGRAEGRTILSEVVCAYLEALATTMLWMKSEDEWDRRLGAPWVVRTILKHMGRLGRVPDCVRTKMIEGLQRATKCGNTRVAQSARQALERHGVIHR